MPLSLSFSDSDFHCHGTVTNSTMASSLMAAGAMKPGHHAVLVHVSTRESRCSMLLPVAYTNPAHSRACQLQMASAGEWLRSHVARVACLIDKSASIRLASGSTIVKQWGETVG